MLNRDTFNTQTLNFLNELFTELAGNSIQFPKHWHIDHICYRSGTQNEYDELKHSFLIFADLLTESPVNGRLISTFRLHEPIPFQDHFIGAVELPQPKANSPYPTGCEHIEIVCDAALNNLPSLYPKLAWNTDSTPKIYNDEIKCTLKSGAIKFHNQSLESVVTLEANTPVYTALIDLNILSELKQFQPLVVGTYPLGLQISSSDIDIVMSHTNLQEIEETLLKFYSYLPDFKMNMSCILDRHSLAAHFVWKGIPFGLFAQRTNSFEQSGYRHFLIEERLLKIHGDSLRNTLMGLRNEGLKTEPAFAKALNLKGDDPYEALLTLYFMSDKELVQLF